MLTKDDLKAIDKLMTKRFDEFEKKMDKRFEEFEKRIDKRFEELERRMEQRFDQMYTDVFKLVNTKIGNLRVVELEQS